MIYKNFKTIVLFCPRIRAMRLPVIGEDDSKIDETAAEKMVDLRWSMASIIMIPHGDIMAAST